MKCLGKVSANMIRTVCDGHNGKEWKFVRRFLPILFVCVLLTGCTGLLDRSYGVVEPYSDRYWDSTAEDTLRAENHQDLVNSLLMLVEERAETGVIRCYGAAASYLQAQAACREVAEETALGDYLLASLTFSYENGTGYSTMTCQMEYREDAEDPDTLMKLSDSQSLVDLLRLAVREEHEKLTARFAYNTPREDVTAAVESLWRELCTDEAKAAAALEPEQPLEQPVEQPAETEFEGEAAAAEEAGEGEDAVEAMDPGEFAPCPWEIRFYPDADEAEIVEVLLVRQ